MKYQRNVSFEDQVGSWLLKSGWQVFYPKSDHGHKTDLLVSNGPNFYRIQVKTLEKRTCQELRGLPCLELDDVTLDKQQIMSSKSFGQPVFMVQNLCEAISTYVERATQKQRAPQSLAGGCQCR